jgi:hypothetical protein
VKNYIKPSPLPEKTKIQRLFMNKCNITIEISTNRLTCYVK